MNSRHAGAQEYELLLRVTERTDRVAHLPRVLYHRGTAAATTDGPPLRIDAAAGRAVLAETMRRRGERVDVFDGLVSGTFRVARKPSGRPRVSVIIPFRDGAGLLRQCLSSLFRTADDLPLEVLLVDNQSWQPETRALLAGLAGDDRLQLLQDPREFNWSALNNLAAASSRGELLLFLNNDVEAISNGWLRALAEHAMRPEVGAVGARLLFPNGLVQHAGVMLGPGGVAGHMGIYAAADSPGYFGWSKTIRNCSAVTGACLMTRREVFESVGGFDEGFPVAFNDVDFCLKIRRAGLRVIYTPYAELIHHESLTRGVADDEPERRRMIDRWAGEIQRDPFFNPNLSREHLDFRLGTSMRESP